VRWNQDGEYAHRSQAFSSAGSLWPPSAPTSAAGLFRTVAWAWPAIGFASIEAPNLGPQCFEPLSLIWTPPMLRLAARKNSKPGPRVGGVAPARTALMELRKQTLAFRSAAGWATSDDLSARQWHLADAACRPRALPKAV